jgi:peroxiredoxin
MCSTPASVVADEPDGARRRLLTLMALPVMAATGIAGCGRSDTTPKIAPAFSYTLLNGSVRSSAALLGQVVLVNFWATTCAVCVQEMPALVALHQALGPQGLQTLAVAVRHDPPALVADFAQRRALPFGVVIDNTGAIADGFGSVRGTPTTFVIDRQGRIALRVEGAPDFGKLQARLLQLLAQA